MTEWKGDGISVWLLLFSLNTKQRVSLELHLGSLSSSTAPKAAEGSGAGCAVASSAQLRALEAEEQLRAAWLHLLALLTLTAFQDRHQGPSPVLLWAVLSHMHTSHRKPHPAWFAKSPQHHQSEFFLDIQIYFWGILYHTINRAF